MLQLQFVLMKLLGMRRKLTLFSSEAVEIHFDRAEYNMKPQPGAMAVCIRWVNSLRLSPFLTTQQTIKTNESETVHSFALITLTLHLQNYMYIR